MDGALDRTANVWGDRTPLERGMPLPPRVDSHVEVADGDIDRWVQSACVLCSNGCGLDIAVKDGRIVGVRGRAEDRVNHGRLGPKGLYGWQANNSPDRLTRPLVRRDGALQESAWDEALRVVVERSSELLRTEGPLSHAFYTTGQLFLEEYYLLTLIARAGIGTPHLDGNTRLCTATAEWALIESFGCDGNPGSYTDIDVCDALFLVGHDALAETVGQYAPERAAEICDVPPGLIRDAARVLGEAERLVSTVLQGVYQSNQATAAAVQVNNVNLLRGMIGRPGATVFQMNGQPTAQNTRETGAKGAMPAR